MQWMIHINHPHSQEFVSGLFSTKEKNEFVRTHKGRGEIVCMGYCGDLHCHTECYDLKGRKIIDEKC